MHKNVFVLCCFLTFGTAFAAGNARLMEQQRNKTFLLNKEIISTLDNVEGQAEVTFSGVVVRGADGKLRIKIDSIDGVAPYSPPRSFSERTKIEYITFEEMLADKNPRTEPSPKQPVQSAPPEQSTFMYGGGSAADN